MEVFVPVEECHIPVDDHKRNKGFAFVRFVKVVDARRAVETLDGTDFQGRLLHVMYARESKDHISSNAVSTGGPAGGDSRGDGDDDDDDDDAHTNRQGYKAQQEQKRQQEAMEHNKGMVRQALFDLMQLWIA